MEYSEWGIKYEIIGNEAVVKGFDTNNKNMIRIHIQKQIPEQVNGKTVVGVADRAFFRSGLNSIQLPSTLRFIGESAFRESEWLMSVYVGHEQLYVGQNINFSDELKIHERAFEGCKKLYTFFSRSHLVIRNRAFANTGLITDLSKMSVLYLAEDAFNMSEDFTKLHIAKNGFLAQGCLANSNIQEIIAVDNIQFGTDVLNKIIQKDISIKTTPTSPLCNLAYIGAKIIIDNTY